MKMNVITLDAGLVINSRAMGEWCQLPYPDHPKGCPNYGKKITCPPSAPSIYDWADFNHPMWFICVSFNLKEHIRVMLEKHPCWSLRQARCLLYWQPKVKKELEIAVKEFSPFGLHAITYCPEAMGVNVIQTAKNYGLPIWVKPENTVYKIALVASPSDSQKG